MVNNKIKKKKRFIAVDVWRPTFGEVSVKAIMELYRTHSGCSNEELYKTKLRDIVNYLRKLEEPNYQPIKLPIHNG